MNNLLENILHEWFARLPKGYATTPYSHDELEILEHILIKNDIEPSPVINKLREAGIESDNDTSGSTDSNKTYENDQSAFVTYIETNYAAEDQGITGLEQLYDSLKKLPEDTQRGVFKLIDIDTSMDFRVGVDQITKEHEVLHDEMKKYIKIANGDWSELWFSIVYGGKASGAIASQGGIETNVTIDGDGVSLKNYKNSTFTNLDFGSLNGDSIRTMKMILSIMQLLFNIELMSTRFKDRYDNSYGRGSINNALKALSDDDVIKSLINDFIDYAKTSELPIIKNIYARINSIIGDRDPADLPNIFCNNVDNMIKNKLDTVKYWAVINNYTIYIKPSEDIYNVLKCTDDNQLSPAINSFHKFNLRVNGKSIFDKVA